MGAVLEPKSGMSVRYSEESVRVKEDMASCKSEAENTWEGVIPSGLVVVVSSVASEKGA